MPPSRFPIPQGTLDMLVLPGIARGSFQVNATSNEPMDPSDVAVTEDENGGLVVELRAERSGAASQAGSIT